MLISFEGGHPTNPCSRNHCFTDGRQLNRDPTRSSPPSLAEVILFVSDTAARFILPIFLIVEVRILS